MFVIAYLFMMRLGWPTGPAMFNKSNGLRPETFSHGGTFRKKLFQIVKSSGYYCVFRPYCIAVSRSIQPV
jgi:hypothetical protein